MFLMGFMSLLWMVYGYSMAFGEGNAFFGNPMQYFLLHGVGGAPNPDYAATVPHQSFMLFQLMFAIITPGAHQRRVCRADALRRVRAVYGALGRSIYFPLAHMVWGKGGYFNWALGGKIPVLDFAGGTGSSYQLGDIGVVCALVLGRRVGYPHEPMPPHSVVLSLIGTGLLWVGWFGFNAGSALGSGELATRAFAATHFSAAAAALSWGATEWYLERHAQCLGRGVGDGGRAGDHHTGGRIRHYAIGRAHRADGRGVLLFGGDKAQSAALAMTIRWTSSECTARAAQWECSCAVCLPARK